MADLLVVWLRIGGGRAPDPGGGWAQLGRHCHGVQGDGLAWWEQGMCGRGSEDAGPCRGGGGGPECSALGQALGSKGFKPRAVTLSFGTTLWDLYGESMWMPEGGQSRWVVVQATAGALGAQSGG